MLQAMVDSPEEAEGWDAPQGERPTSTGGTMTSSTLHRILQVSLLLQSRCSLAHRLARVAQHITVKMDEYCYAC